jgi:hypothetical protein
MLRWQASRRRSSQAIHSNSEQRHLCSELPSPASIRAPISGASGILMDCRQESNLRRCLPARVIKSVGGLRSSAYQRVSYASTVPLTIRTRRNRQTRFKEALCHLSYEPRRVRRDSNPRPPPCGARPLSYKRHGAKPTNAWLDSNQRPPLWFGPRHPAGRRLKANPPDGLLKSKRGPEIK